MAQYLLDNKERLQAYHRENWHYGQFGISKDNFAKLLASQGGCCGICKTTNPGAGKTWHLDHDHKYDKKDPQGHRGLLCHRCNVALGLFGDSVVNLQAAIAYLARQKEAAE